MNINRVETSAGMERRKFPVRRETIVVLVEHLSLAQRTGQWLSNETHGDAYSHVRELNEYLHQAQRKLREIQGRHAMSRAKTPGSMDWKFEYGPG